MKVGAGSRRAVLAAAMVWASGSAWAADVDIPAQGLATALESLARQAHIQVLYSADLVTGLNSRPVKGALAPADALRTVLTGSGLDAVPTAEGNFAIVRAAAASQLDAIPVPVAGAEEDYRAATATIGSKVPVELKDVPNSVSVLTRQQMDDQNLVDLDHALAWVPGVTIRPNDSAQSWPQARGYALGVMHDGVPSYDALAGYQQFDLAMYERVEVLRGPTGLFQGSSDPGGSVNLVRKRPTDTAQASGTVAAGSWDYKRSSFDVSTPITADKTVKTRLVGAFTDRDFFFDDAHSQKWLGYGIVEYDPNPDWSFAYSVAHQSDDNSDFFGVPTYSNGAPISLSRSTNLNTPWTHADWVTDENKLEAEHRFGNGWTAKVAGRWQQQKYAWRDGYSGGVNQATQTSTYTLVDGEATYFRRGLDSYVDGPFRLFGREHNLLLGTNVDIYGKDWFRGRNSTWYTNVPLFSQSSIPERIPERTTGSETRTSQFGEYGQLRFRVLDPWTVIIGARNTNFDSDSRSWSNTTGWGQWSQGSKAKNELTRYAGTTLDVTPQTTLYTSYSDIFVPQTEQTASGLSLPPRVGWQVEAGVKNKFFDDKLNVSAAAFLIRDTNRAMLDPASPVGVSNYLAAGEVESKGVDIEVSGSPTDNLKLSGGYSLLVNQYVDDKGRTGSVFTSGNTGNTFSTWEPRHSLKLWGIYTFTDSTLDGFSIGAGANAKSRTWNTGTQLHQKAFAVFDAQLGYKINDKLDATLTVNNVFDTEYWATMRSNTNNLYGEPRSFMLALKAEL